VTSACPVASIEAATLTTGRAGSGAAEELPEVAAEPPATGADESAGDDFPELLQAPANMPMVTAAQIPVQRRHPRAEARIMDAEWTPVPRSASAQFLSTRFPTARDASGSYTSATHGSAEYAASYLAKLAELELLLEILEQSRAAAAAAATAEKGPQGFLGDPVALTQALHPDGLRSARRSTRHAPGREHPSIPVRVVVLDGSSRG